VRESALHGFLQPKSGAQIFTMNCRAGAPVADSNDGKRSACPTNLIRKAITISGIAKIREPAGFFPGRLHFDF
jgi:hypothetical protein